VKKRKKRKGGGFRGEMVEHVIQKGTTKLEHPTKETKKGRKEGVEVPKMGRPGQLRKDPKGEDCGKKGLREIGRENQGKTRKKQRRGK